MKALIQKYDRRGPRYTSYPPVPFWKNKPTQYDWFAELNRSLKEDPFIDLYLHIPFCEKLCYYCGCHRTITKDKSKSQIYAEALMKEWKVYLQNISTPFKISSLHFGGGTPTFLRPEDLENLLKKFKSHFTDDFIGAIEIDPRTVTKAHLDILAKYKFTRMSLGIQDFDANVQRLINRVQSFEMVKELVDKIRQFPDVKLNFDLIFGLPGQNLNTIRDTLQKVSELSPDNIAYYSYAHLPEQIPNQRLIKTEDLPAGETKLELYLAAQEYLKTHGYQDIGMDHFAKIDSHLANKELTRNFMGYTDKKSNTLIGLGCSAIGQTQRMFAQNQKDQNLYYESIEVGQLPLANGHMLSKDEERYSSHMQDLFCRGEIAFEQNVQFDQETLQDLQELEDDGLVIWHSPTHLKATQLGKKFLRNIAMAIDPLLKGNAQTSFSRTI